MNMDQDNTPEDREAGAAVMAEFANLDALEAEALTLDPPKLAPGEEPPPPMTLAERIDGNAALMDLLWSVSGPMLPERYAERYGESQRQKIVVAWTKLEIARGWDMGEIMGRWAPEITFLGAVLAPALPVIMSDLKARKGAAHERDQQTGA